MDDGGGAAGPADREAEIVSVCQAVSDLLQAQEILIETLRAQGMLDSRATGVLAAIDQLKAEAEHTRQRASVRTA
ncbi:hypothetical protein [Actinoplanes sp. NPDC049599]|uniref:hypothetical protein n=1 Tax=Actinoplanes sp. NPDC049599 TaxID=3363903 RepID=UPI0037B30E14